MLMGRRGVDDQARAIFFRSLGTMFSSGVSLVVAMEMLAEQQDDPTLATACLGMCRKLLEGNPLSKAMSAYPAIFSNLHQKMIFSGERSGQLNAVLLRLADREEGQREMQLRLRNALTLPLIVSALCILLVVLVPPLLFKGLFQMLQEQGTSIPWTTQVMIKLSAFVTSPWCPLLLGLAALALHRAWRRLWVDAGWQQAMLRLPVFGPTLRLYYVASFMQNLRTMLDVGVPILQALELSAAGTDLTCLQAVVAEVRESLEAGDPLSYALHKTEFFPPALMLGLRASEEAGKLTHILERLEQIFRMDLEQRLEMGAKAFEPLVLVVIGSMVAFILIATLQPMLAVLDKL